MKTSAQTPQNPLGLNIDFLFGRGYLWAKNERLSDWITLESLRMEIPDLQFPFDARGGLGRFRNTRCLVREIELGISESGLQEWLRRAASQIDGFTDLRVRFVEGAIHVGLFLEAYGADAYMSFKIALIPPEPARADELHVSLYDYRAYGQLPFPARLIAFHLLTGLLDTPAMRPPGRGRSFTVGVAGDILSLRPLKLLLLNLFPSVGWKLPNLSDVTLDGARVRPGQLSLRASSADASFYRKEDASAEFSLLSSKEGARALAAYEAKDLFYAVDQAIFERDADAAMDQLAALRQIYGPHPELLGRALDVLLANPTPANLAEADAAAAELHREDPGDPRALLARARLVIARRRPNDEILGALDRLAAALKERGELDDWILCALTASELARSSEPGDAIRRLREVLKASPRHMGALLTLRDLYADRGEWTGYEEILKRLTGVHSGRDALKKTYLELAEHLMERRGHIAEARLYLEKVLRLDPGDRGALRTLGESYVLGGEPLRALKAFGSAARAAESGGDLARAWELLSRVARLWRGQLENPGEALLNTRRALELFRADGGPERDPLAHADLLAFAAECCVELERGDEALGYLLDVVPLLERAREGDLPAPPREGPGRAERGLTTLGGAADAPEAPDDVAARLVAAHRTIAGLYEERERPDAAASHWRRLLELTPEDDHAASHLEAHYRRAGRPEQLLDFLRDLIDRAGTQRRRVDLGLDLAEAYAALQMTEEAREELERLLAIDPELPEPLEQLIGLLRTANRFETLRDALDRLLLRARDRDTRLRAQRERAAILLDPLGDPRRATRAYFEALDLDPAALDILRGARRALEQIIAAEGPTTPAPVGDSTAGELSERVLERLVSRVDDAHERATLLDEIAALARGRGDEAAATEAARRAEATRLDAAHDAQPRTPVAERLDALLAPDPAPPSGAGDESSAAFTLEELSRPTRRNPRLSVADLPDLSSIGLEGGADPSEAGSRPDQPDPVPSDQSEVSEFDLPRRPGLDMSAFREQLKRTLKAPADLPSPEELRSGKSPLADFMRASAKTPVGTPPPNELIELSRSLDEPTEAALEADVAFAALLSDVDAARGSADADALADALERTLEASDANASLMQDDQVVRMSRELGELLYYDLELSERARPHLERVRRLDPDGQGSEASVVNALESIYEEGGHVQQRVRLLRQRMEAATGDLADTYRLLIAQLQWDELGDLPAARATLDPLLERDPDHESAHRLLAEIARSTEDWEAAAHHIDRALAERAGGLDEVEMERDLAMIYLEHLERPTDALARFRAVLEAAPHDAQAIEGARRALASMGEWEAYIDELSSELELLAPGSYVSLSGDEPLDPASFPNALRTTAAHILADAARVAQDHLEDLPRARTLWGDAFAAWPEFVDALEARLALDRQLDAHADLARDLESMADLLLDPAARFDHMVEAATLHEQVLDDPESARRLLAEAIASAGDDDLPGLDAARRALTRLQAD
jgi:tetratricopeptide (TPR) repeat protein